jgi:hypothetical protein
LKSWEVSAAFSILTEPSEDSKSKNQVSGHWKYSIGRQVSSSLGKAMIPTRFYIPVFVSLILTPNCFAQNFHTAKVKSPAAGTMFIYPARIPMLKETQTKNDE